MLEHRIMLVDDHPLFRSGLRRILDQDPRMEVVAEAGNGHEALRLAAAHRPVVVVMDVQLPGVTGLQTASVLRRSRPRTRVLFLSMHLDDKRLAAAIRVGAAGFLTKDAEPSAIVDAIRTVCRGRNLLRQAVLADPVLARRVLRELRSAPGRGSEPPLGERALSPRELAVLDCLVMGCTNKEIGEALYITEQTVKNHMTGVLRKLAVPDRVGALHHAIVNGWAEVGPQPYAAVESPPGLEAAAAMADR